MSGDRLLREMDPASKAYREKFEEVWAEIQAKTQAAEAKRAQAGTEQVQPPETTKIEHPTGGWMAKHEAHQDDLEDKLREEFNRLPKKPSKPESKDIGLTTE